MKITYTGNGTFSTDGVTLTENESVEVDEERGAFLLEQHPEILTGAPSAGETRSSRRSTPAPTHSPEPGTAASDSEE